MPSLLIGLLPSPQLRKLPLALNLFIVSVLIVTWLGHAAVGTLVQAPAQSTATKEARK